MLQRYPKTEKVGVIDLDPMEDPSPESLMPIKEVKTIQIGPKAFWTLQIGSGLAPNEELRIIHILRKKLDLFAWKPIDMPGIDPDIMCHQLAIDPTFKTIAQRKQKTRGEKEQAIVEEVGKLLKADSSRKSNI